MKSLFKGGTSTTEYHKLCCLASERANLRILMIFSMTTNHEKHQPPSPTAIQNNVPETPEMTASSKLTGILSAPKSCDIYIEFR